MNIQIQSKPKLLVTGARGLVGSRLLELAAGRYEVIPLDRAEGDDIRNATGIGFAIAAHAEAAALIHLAAYTNVSLAHTQEGDRAGACWATNVEGTRNVVAACKRSGIHMVHVSTDFVFDGEKAAPYTEEDRPSPIEWYGRTKLAAEEAVRQERDWTIVRTAFPYAAGPAPRADVVRGIHGRLAAGGDANLFTDQIITPTLIDDLAHGLLLAARVRPRGEVYHLAGGTSLTPFDLGLKIARVFHFDAAHVRPGLMSEYLKKDPRPRHKRLRIGNGKWTAFATLHGLHPPVGIDEGLARVAAGMGREYRQD